MYDIEEVKIKNNEIKIPNCCEPYFYNTYDDLNKVNVGDVLTLKFGKKPYGVKKEFCGKELKFVVKNFMEHNWRRPTKRLALVPLEKKDFFKESDVVILDDGDRFDCLMIDLFPINRVPYKGWRNRTVKFKID